jgi:Na+-translocating ferredoxin:NAD+ oxidoreductase RnfG subunit
MTSVILAILAFVSIALFGWVIAEVKGNVCNYNATEEEKEAEANAKKNLLKDGYWHEMNIKDVIKTISTKGFDAV